MQGRVSQSRFFSLALDEAALAGLLICCGRSELQSHPKAVHGGMGYRFERECDQVPTAVLSCT